MLKFNAFTFCPSFCEAIFVGTPTFSTEEIQYMNECILNDILNSYWDQNIIEQGVKVVVRFMENDGNYSDIDYIIEVDKIFN